MIIILFSLTLATIISLVMSLALVLSDKNLLHREKSTPFECGFDMNNANRVPFSLRFFLITIVFLIFDVEIVILLPFVKSVIMVDFLYWWMTTIVFILVLLLGLFHEWNQNALKWSM